MSTDLYQLIKLDGGSPVQVQVYPCARRWADLTATPIESVRHGHTCDQRVHEIQDVDGLKAAIADRKCVRVMQRIGGHFLGGMKLLDPPQPTELTWDD